MTATRPARGLDTHVISSPSLSSGARAAAALPGKLYGGRYRIIEIIGAGGFGVVWRADDELMKVPAVVKVIRLQSRAEVEYAEHLLASTQIETRLNHRHIAPIRARGQGDGELWLAMDLIEGGTFVDLVADLYPTRDVGRLSTRSAMSSDGSDWPAVVIADDGRPVRESVLTVMGETLRLLVQASRGVGAAHALDIAHRDLKPDNLMYAVRNDGEPGRSAVVIDWGLALARGPNAPPTHPVPSGAVIGVRAYLSPERRAGTDDGSVRSDVYALGAILYYILTGTAPRDDGPPAALDATELGAQIPEWAAVCQTAMAPAPEDRYRDATAFADALEAASEEVGLRNNDEHRRRALEFLDKAERLDAEARIALAAFDPWDDTERRRPAWALQDEAEQLRYAAAHAEARWLAGIEASLRRMPDLPAGHLRLADHHAHGLLRADEAHRPLDVRLHEDRLRAACDELRRARDACRIRGLVLPPATLARIDDALTTHEQLLAGRARLSLVTDPPGLRVEHAPIVVRERRWVEGERVALGVTPLSAVEIPHGAGVLHVHVGDGTTVVHSLRVHRNEHWDGIAPGDTAPTPIVMPSTIALGPDEAYVPAGWATVGGGRSALDPVERRRVWVDAFVMARNPVTFADYAAFLRTLSPDELHRHLPRTALADETQAPTFGITHREDGRVVVADEFAALPVCCVDWWSARAYARWRAEVTGLAWRLPCQWEYEKAARGGDGRHLPWGDHMEERWTCVVNSTAAAAQPMPVTAETRDVSVHGIRWLAGNRTMWCLDTWSPEAPPAGSRVEIPSPSDDPTTLRISRGSAFCLPPYLTSATSRFSDPPRRGGQMVGVRLVRSVTHPSQEAR